MKQKRTGIIKTSFSAYAMIIPGMAIFAVFVLIPVIQTAYYSLTDWNGLKEANFIGFSNYIELLTSETSRFYIALKNNLFWMILGTTIPIFLGIFQANMLVRHQHRFSHIWQLIFFMPQILSVTVTCIIWTWLYEPTNGPINAILGFLGLESLQTSWLGNPDVVMWSLLGIYIWIAYGFDTVVFCAAMQGIHPQYYEAAVIDGANLRHQFWHITLPGISGTLISTILLQIISSFKVLDVVFLTTKGGPGYHSYILSYYAYTEGIKNIRVGYSAAISITLAILLFSVSAVYQKMTAKKR